MCWQSDFPANIPHPTHHGSQQERPESGSGYRRGREVPYRGPVGPNLPLTADLELAGAGGLRLLQVLAAVGLHCQAAVGIHLAAQNLAVLHAQAAGFAALGPLPDVPAGSRDGLGGGEGGRRRLVNRNTEQKSPGPLPRAVSKGHVTVSVRSYKPVRHAIYCD